VDQISHYRIVRRLGAGGMGEVWRAVDERLGRDVAIKLLARGRASPERALRMLREAQAASGLNHPGIVTVHDIGEIDGQPYLVMELVEGRRFSDLGRITPAEALRLCALAADALGAAHERGILHRDIKSDNLMRLPDGRVKVLDFGLAKVMGAGGGSSDARRTSQNDDEPVTPVSPLAATLAGDSAEPAPAPPAVETVPSGVLRTPITPGTELTRVGDIVGTPAYMAPEQARGEPVDGRSEIFSLGVVLYELLVGRRPFLGHDIESTLELVRRAQATPPSQATENPALAPLDPLVLGALARDPAERPRDMRTIASELRAAADAIERPVAPRRRHRTRRIAVASGLTAVGTAALVFLFHRGRQTSVTPPARAPDTVHLGSPTRLTLDTGCAEFPSISRDGHTTVFDTVRGADYVLEAIDDHGQRRTLTDGPGWDVAPAISPDGKSIAFLRKSGTPYRAMLTDIAARTPPEAIADGAMRPAWSPDGNFLWAGTGHTATRWNIHTRRPDRTLTVPAGLVLLMPLELGDGSVAGVMLKPQELTNPVGIALFPPGGAMKWLYEGEVDEVIAQLPDGAILASRVLENKRELVRIPPDGAPVASFDAPQIDAHKGVSATPDWKRVTWSDCASHTDVATVTKSGGGHDFAPVIAGDWADAFPAQVGDRRLVVVISDRGDNPEPWLVDLDGITPARRIAHLEVSHIAVAPDGVTLVYNTGDGTVGKVALDGKSAPVQLADGGGDGTPAVGTDGLLYFDREEAGTPRVYAVPLAGGAAHPALPPGSQSAAPSPVAPRMIYAKGAPGMQHVMMRDLTTSAEHVLSRELPVSGPWQVRFSADGTKAAVMLSASDLFVVDVESGKVLDHVTAPSRSFLGAALIGPHGESLLIGETWWRGSIWKAERG
jgi:serine/threonine protein kinase